MFSNEKLKNKFSTVSAKTLSLAGSKYLRSRNEKTIQLEAPFVYETLSTPKSVRLLQLHHGAKTDIISLDLNEFNLEDEPVFEALSYTWQLDSEVNKPLAEKEERPILVNGKTLLITMSLYYALLEFRAFDANPLLWVDQISMNQQDSKEKGEQLAIMQDIYRSAAQVRIWLGKSSDRRERQIGSLAEIAERTAKDISDPLQQYERTPSGNIVPSMSRITRLRETAASMTSFVKMAARTASFELASDFLSNRWFTRAWTLQEFRLAKKYTFYVGDWEVRTDAIRDATEALIAFNEHSIFLTLALGQAAIVTVLERPRLEAIRALFDEQGHFDHGRRLTSEEYLRVIRQREATVPKDKVFAGAALLQANTALGISYNRTTRDIFENFATQRLWPELSNQTLAYVGGVASTIDGLTSWIPDLGTPIYPEPLRLCGGLAFPSPFGLKEHVFQIDNGTLLVQAARWTTVRAVGESAWAWRKYGDHPYGQMDLEGKWKLRDPKPLASERFGLMFALLNEIGVTYAPTSESTLDVLWQIFVCGIADLDEEKRTLWRKRFYRWFAYSLTALRYLLWLETRSDMQKLALMATKRKWFTPVAVDRHDMEKRVENFLTVHDGDGKLRAEIVDVSTKIIGAASAEQATYSGASGMHWLMDFDTSYLKPITEFLHRFKQGYEGRRIFVTENGYLGSAVEDVSVGDVVCLIAGTDAPYVLRPATDRPDAFMLIGEAYVHGVMDGRHADFNSLDFKSVGII